MAQQAIICGGSIGGLFAAGALLKAGWAVRVLERSAVELAGRGAGIVTHPELLAAMEAVGATTDDLGVEVTERVAFDRAGARVHAFDFHQVVTSWDRMYQVLRPLVPEGAYRLGAEVARYDDRGDRVSVEFADGSREEADLLVGADGFRSVIRGQMLPEITPAYSGYIVWRTTGDEGDLPRDVRDDLFKTFGYFIPNGMQAIGYPIAGLGNDLRPGHRRFNFVWYAGVSAERLRDMRTDATGREHAWSIPPPLIREDVIAAMYAEAPSKLSDPFARTLETCKRPFFTPIYDHLSPEMGRGRVALVGDAACVARPHVGMGVTKAAEDASALASIVKNGVDDGALTRYSASRVPACRQAFEAGRWLGSLMIEATSPANADGRAHPEMETVMRQTAVVPGSIQAPPRAG